MPSWIAVAAEDVDETFVCMHAIRAWHETIPAESLGFLRVCLRIEIEVRGLCACGLTSELQELRPTSLSVTRLTGLREARMHGR